MMRDMRIFQGSSRGMCETFVEAKIFRRRMRRSRLREFGPAWALVLLLITSGCRAHRKTVSAPNSTDYAPQLQALAGQSQMPALRWPNYADYQNDVKTFYDDRNSEVAWTRDGKPTAAANGFIEAFRAADRKGLRPADYDADRWDGRVSALQGKSADAIATFDVAMTINVMRFISDLRIGRVNPQHFNFDIDLQSKKYNLPEFVSDQAVDETDVPKLVLSVEPDAEEYRKTEEALAHYRDLAKQQAAQPAQPLPDVAKAIGPGGHYQAVGELWQRLQMEGDAASGGAAPAIYDDQVSQAVKSYQARHGLTSDGTLSEATVKSLNVPLSDQVLKLESSLERWRWLPDPYLHPRLMVNLPEFVLRGYDESHKEQFKMKVVVGKSVGEHDTPVFAHMMKYLIFRPYWNVPTDIAKKELVPHMEKSPGYLEAHNYEAVNSKGEVQSDVTTAKVEHANVLVREKPGPKNSLGLVKFMFPNQYDIYLHSTSQQELFSRSKRDFSHGCVRVEKPADLAAWVLEGQKDKDGQDWDLEHVNDAMQTGEDNHQVNLKTPLPIVIFYLTARVDENGNVDFFDDLYGYDADMQKVLDNGPPYPVKPDPSDKTAQPGDTA